MNENIKEKCYMSMLTELEALGVNTEEALRRFMNNSALYVRMLGKYPAAAENSAVAEKFAAKDYEAALTETHTLKGVSGNLSLTPLFKDYSEIVTLLREGKNDDAEALYEKTAVTEKQIIDCIKANS